jgi:hypothetical protein
VTEENVFCRFMSQFTVTFYLFIIIIHISISVIKNGNCACLEFSSNQVGFEVLIVGSVKMAVIWVIEGQLLPDYMALGTTTQKRAIFQ